MKMNKDHTLYELVLILSGTILNLYFLNMSKPYWVLDPGWSIKFTLSFFIASFISSAFGMIFEFRSRVGGIFLLVVFLQFAQIFNDNGFLRLDGIILGLAVTGFLTCYSLVNNRFDRLALYLRRLVKIFFSFTSLYLLYQFLYNYTVMDSSNVVPVFRLSSSDEILRFLFLIAIFYSICFLLTKNIHGIKACDIFVYGPPSSGKTLLLLAFYRDFINLYKGERKEFIISERNKENLTIESMLIALENGELPKNNLRTDLAIYLLSGKKNFKPVRMTFIDYGGGLAREFEPAHFKEIIAELSERFYNIRPLTLEQNITNLDFIMNLKDKHREDFSANVDKIIFAYLYKKFENSGKIIFLVDGDYVVSYYNEGKTELIELFGHCSRIIKFFGSEKSYAFVVTNTDKFDNLSNTLEDSIEAKSIEHQIYDLFCEILTFKEIVNVASRIPIYLFTTSVDATMAPIVDDEESELQHKSLKINPWRIEEIEKFSF